MAVQKEYASAFGVTFPEAYWMISTVYIIRVGKCIDVNVDIFASKEAREREANPIGVFYLPIRDANGYDEAFAGGVPALYSMLKETPEMSGGVDV